MKHKKNDIQSNDCYEYIVDVNNVSVRFNKANETVDNLKEYFVKLIKKQLMYQEFLALQDVSLKIKKGEAWAIIGTNGSGKSTLLKVISHILKPYQGTCQTHGNIASLIELSAGFNSKLTVKENIYLNGCLLGYSKEFIKLKFNDIVEFSELNDFLHVPVKNLSSGMKSRLGFAIATMMDPDILIVDEVLSVGDILFRKKCMNRMREMINNGATLLFVSHNMNTVKSICNKAIWLDNGKVEMQGNVEDVTNEYVAKIEKKKEEKKNKKRKLN